jgi:hypothetical protein
MILLTKVTIIALGHAPMNGLIMEVVLTFMVLGKWGSVLPDTIIVCDPSHPTGY